MATDLHFLEPLSNETPNAYQAFCDYVEMGYLRSLTKLQHQYQARTDHVPTRQITTLKTWSKKYEWQQRLNQYQQSIAIQSQQSRIEAYNVHIDQALPMAESLLTHIGQMLGDFQRLRTTRRQVIDDPRDSHLPEDQRRRIESIQTKVNVNDLQKLIAAYGQLNRDLRTALGLPTVTEIQGIGETIIKTYVGVTPDDWDTEPTPALPEKVDAPEQEDPVEEFPE